MISHGDPKDRPAWSWAGDESECLLDPHPPVDTGEVTGAVSAVEKQRPRKRHGRGKKDLRVLRWRIKVGRPPAVGKDPVETEIVIAVRVEGVDP